MDIQFKQTIKIFGVLVGVLLFGVLLGVSLSDMGYVPVSKNLPAPVRTGGGLASLGATQHKEEILVGLVVDYGNGLPGQGDTQVFPQESLRAGDTVYDLLENLRNRHGVTVEERNFPGLGKFIEAIHGVHNTNTSYWQFWVNGEYSQTGAELYELRDGDEVLWKRTSERIEKF